MHDTSERGSTGIGGLLILLALIIVAMIAAGTVLYLAGELRQQTDGLPYISLLVLVTHTGDYIEHSSRETASDHRHLISF